MPESRLNGPILNLIEPAQKALALWRVVVQNAASASRLDHCDTPSDRADIGRIIPIIVSQNVVWISVFLGGRSIRASQGNTLGGGPMRRIRAGCWSCWRAAHLRGGDISLSAQVIR